jgi:hypothetical protein
MGSILSTNEPSDKPGTIHSLLKLITPANARDLILKWVYQSRSLDKNETTPLVVDGVMFTVQSETIYLTHGQIPAILPSWLGLLRFLAPFGLLGIQFR